MDWRGYEGRERQQHTHQQTAKTNHQFSPGGVVHLPHSQRGVGHDLLGGDTKESASLCPIESSNALEANSLWCPERMASLGNSCSLNAIECFWSVPPSRRK